MDRQSQAFRECPDRYTRTVDYSDAVWHEPITDLSGIRLPDQYEAAVWDRTRGTPKTVEEARQALLARIDDPAAPDGDDERSAYDDLGS